MSNENFDLDNYPNLIAIPYAKTLNEKDPQRKDHQRICLEMILAFNASVCLENYYYYKTVDEGDDSKSKKDLNGKQYYVPSFVPNIPIKDSDIFVYPLYGQRFDSIAYDYYGNSNLWWIIAKANELGKGQIGLDPEKKIRIPTEIGDIIELVENSNG